MRNFYNHNKRVLQKTLIKKIADCTLGSQKNRSSHQRCSIMKGILRNFAKFTGKALHLTVSFLIKLQTSTVLWKRLWHRCFLVNFANILRTPFLQNTSGRLFLKKLWRVLRIVLQSEVENICLNPNLGWVFRGCFWGGGAKITPPLSKTC